MGQGTSRGHFEPYPGLQVDDDGSDIPCAHSLERPATGRASFSGGEGRRSLTEMGGRRSFQGRPSTASSNRSGLGRFADPVGGADQQAPQCVHCAGQRAAFGARSTAHRSCSSNVAATQCEPMHA